MTIEKRSKLRWIILSILVGCGALYGGLWVYFHSIPLSSDLIATIERADFVEVYRMKDGRPIRSARLEDPSRWKALAESLRFQARFWQFSSEPTDTIVFQTIAAGPPKSRTLALEVRGDGCIHVRKAARWYRMPIDPAFEEQIREILRVDGQDLTDEEIDAINKTRAPSFSP